MGRCARFARRSRSGSSGQNSAAWRLRRRSCGCSTHNESSRSIGYPCRRDSKGEALRRVRNLLVTCRSTGPPHKRAIPGISPLGEVLGFNRRCQRHYEERDAGKWFGLPIRAWWFAMPSGRNAPSQRRRRLSTYTNDVPSKWPPRPLLLTAKPRENGSRPQTVKS